jgi:hypothetical protein
MVQNNEPLRNQTDLSNLRIVWIRMPGPRWNRQSEYRTSLVLRCSLYH